MTFAMTVLIVSKVIKKRGALHTNHIKKGENLPPPKKWENVSKPCSTTSPSHAISFQKTTADILRYRP